MRLLITIAMVIVALASASAASAVSIGRPVFGPGLRDHGSICSYVTFGRCALVNDFSWIFWTKS